MMRFFAKVAMVCNACFIISVILRFVDIAFQKKGNYDGVLLYQPLKSTIVILGYGAIVVNLLYLFLIVANKIVAPKVVDELQENGNAFKKKAKNITIFLIVLFTILQLIYFFLPTI